MEENVESPLVCCFNSRRRTCEPRDVLVGLILGTELGNERARAETWILWHRVLNVSKHGPVALNIHEMWKWVLFVQVMKGACPWILHFHLSACLIYHC